MLYSQGQYKTRDHKYYAHILVHYAWRLFHSAANYGPQTYCNCYRQQYSWLIETGNVSTTHNSISGANGGGGAEGRPQDFKNNINFKFV